MVVVTVDGVVFILELVVPGVVLLLEAEVLFDEAVEVVIFELTVEGATVVVILEAVVVETVVVVTLESVVVEAAVVVILESVVVEAAVILTELCTKNTTNNKIYELNIFGMVLFHDKSIPIT